MSQSKFIFDLLKEIGMLGCKLEETPIIVLKKKKPESKKNSEEESKI